MRLHRRNFVVRSVQPFSSVSREVIGSAVPLGYLWRCHHCAKSHAEQNNPGWGDGCWRDPFCRVLNSSCPALRCHPPAADSTTPRLLARSFSPHSCTPSASENKPLSILFSTKCGREHHHLQLSAAFRSCTAATLLERDWPNQQNPSHILTALA